MTTPTPEEQARQIVESVCGKLEETPLEAVMGRGLRELIDRIASALHEARPQWREIETAPKDGTLFLAWVIGSNKAGMVRFVNWGKTAHVPLYGFCTRDEGVEDDSLCMPTHWMPLPSPPE